jgi:hypothetical protein
LTTKTTPKTNEKRRCIAQTLVDDVATQESPPEIAFDVDKRALKVFRTIFFSPSSGALSGEIAWLNFFHALVSTGFAAEKLYESVWQFTPTKLDVETGIQDSVLNCASA